MPSVDNRVVEMRFDNKDFEGGVSTSLNSIEKLKKSLNFKNAADGFKDIERSARGVDMSSLSSAMDAVTDKFSVFGTIGDQILRRIGDEVYKLASQFTGLIKSMSIDQITAGWQKYNDETTYVQTIMNATGGSIDEVNGYLDKLMWFSDETSYGFNDMASAIASMTSTGGDIGKLIPLVEGFANAVAFAGKGPAEFSRLMSTAITSSYGMGYLTSQDFRQLKTANVASKQLIETLIAAGVELGKIEDGEVDLANFTESLNDHWADTEVMEKAFGYFSEMTEKAYELIELGEFDTATEAYEYLSEQFNTVSMKAAKAAQEAKTFEEAIDATKDAVSSKWQTTWKQLFGNYEEAKVLWSWLAEELWEVFAEPGDTRNEMLALWHDGIDGVSGYAMAIESLQNIWYGFKNILYAVKDAVAEVFPPQTAENLITITEKIRDATESFRNAFSYDKGDSLIGALLDGDNNDSLEETVVSLEEIESLGKRIMSGEFGNGAEVRRAAIEALDLFPHAYELAQNWVNAQYGVADAYEVTDVAITDANENIESSMDGVNNTLDDTIAGINGFSRSIMDPTGFNAACEELGYAANISDNITILKNVVGGLAGAFDILKQAVSASWEVVIQPALKSAGKLIRPLLVRLGEAGVKLKNLAQTWRENDTIKNFLQGIVDGFKQAKERFDGFMDQAKQLPSVTRFLGYFEQFKNWINGIKTSALDGVSGFFSNLDVTKYLPSQETLLSILDTAVTKINDFIELCQEGWPEVQAFFQGLDFSSLTNLGSSVGSGISDFFSGLFSNEDLQTTGSGMLTSLWEGIKASAANINWSELLSIVFKSLTAVTGASIGFGFADLLFSLGGLADGLAEIPEKVVDILGGVGGVLDGYASNLKADSLLKIAEAIGILALALIGLSFVPSEKLTTVVGTVIPMIAVLALLANTVGRAMGSISKIGSTVEGGLVSIGKLNVKIPKLGITLLGFGIALMGIATAVGVIALAIDKLGSGKVWQAVGVIGAVMGIFAVFAVIMKLIDKIKVPEGSKGTSMMTMAGSFAVMMLGINLMLPTLLVLAALPMDKALTAVGSIAGLMIAFGAVALMSKNNKNMAGTAAGFLIMAMAIDALLPALVVMSTIAAMNLTAMLAAAGTILGVVIVFGIVFAALSNVKDPKAGLEAMLSIAVAIAAIGAVMAVLKGSTFGELMAIAGAIMIFVGVMGALGYLAGTFPAISTGLIAIGVAIALIGAGVGLAGVGALAFAEALNILAASSTDAQAAGENLALGIVAFFDTLVANGQSILIFVSMLIAAILAVIVAHKAHLVTTMVGVVEALATALSSGSTLNIILVALGTVLAGLFAWLSSKIPGLASALISMGLLLIASFIQGMLDNLPMMRSMVTAFLQTLGYMILEGLVATFGTILDPLADIFGWTWWDNLKAGLEGAETETSEALDETISNLQQNVDDNLSELSETVETESAETAEAIQSGNAAVADAMSESGTPEVTSGDYVEWVDTTYTDVATAAETGSASAVEAIDAGNEDISTSLQTMIDSASGEMDTDGFYDFLSGAGENGVLGFVEGIDTNSFMAGDAFSSMGDDSLNSLLTALDENSPSRKTMEAGQYAAEGLAQGISNNKYRASIASYYLASAALSGLSGVYSNFYSYGGYAAQGFAAGMYAYSYLVADQARRMASDAYTAAADELASKSPSRKFKELGMYADQGFAIGVDKYAYLASDSVGAMAEGTLSGIKDVVKRISDAIDGDFDMDPTIRPVLDLSEIQNGAEQLGGMFKTQNVDVTSTPMKNAQTISSIGQNYGTLGYSSNDSKMDDLISAVNKTAETVKPKTATINNYITVSGAENPEDYANRLVRQLNMQIRMG